MESDLVRYSRAGDVFHYRWAARRCLKMIYPKSKLQYIVIEGSSECDLAGEYVIDVAEYSKSHEADLYEIAYFQLKHSTVKQEQPFQLSDLKGTIVGFAKRYSQLCSKNNTPSFSKITFTIVTNRPIAEPFKKNMSSIAKGESVDKRFQNTLKEYTNLNLNELKSFCAVVNFADGEGDYDAQRYELQTEISQIVSGTIDNPIIENIIALVHKKVLPNSDGRIIREEILKTFGVTNERELFPAPPEFEEFDNAIVRSQHETLLDYILNASSPIIIHAAGGVGKSVFACQMAQSLPNGSVGLVYDCFGGGSYRKRSEPRHRHRDALVQIINQLASYGLCDPIIALSSSLEDQILKDFLIHLGDAIKALRKTNADAIIAIFIDAADNAEMAAKQYSQPCFVNELLREDLVEGCRIIALCRTERIHLLEPSSKIFQVELEQFNKKETLLHLRRRFSDATEIDGEEFYRLTNNGNPRVQANALTLGLRTISETLASLGLYGKTVEEQIEAQLESAMSNVKDRFPSDYQSHLNAICVGLATLPPFVPLNVLSTIAEVDESTVKSFVADLGRPLWFSDTAVQFRDEPTESWFRKTFSATSNQIASYVELLQPLAYKYRYVAEALPSLLLQAEKYADLIDLALSDQFIPKGNPVEARNIRVYRLQFAFKAALKLRRYDHAVKLALRAGEEVAGDERQRELLLQNVDLIAPLQDEQRVQELALRRMLRSGWKGSENLYSAALLSTVEEYKGEARGYYRAAINWLYLYLDERKQNKDNFHQDELSDDDIVELIFACCNLEGVSNAVEYLLSWRPQNLAYRVGHKFIRRIIDAGSFDIIDEIFQLDIENQYLMIAIVQELIEVGRFPNASFMEQCLISMATKRTRISIPDFSHNDNTASAIVSFMEACAASGLPAKLILRVLKRYFPIRASQSVSSNYQNKDRNIYFRVVALRCVLSNIIEPELDKLLPKEFIRKEKNHRDEQNIRELKEIMSALLPWYIVRARIIVNGASDLCKEANEARDKSSKVQSYRWKEYDIIPSEILHICFGIMTLCRNEDDSIQCFYDAHIKDNKHIRLEDLLNAVRSAFRLEHLSSIRNQLEQTAYEIVTSATEDGPERKGDWYIKLARAVLPKSRDDAATYFNFGIEAVSKFGDEIVERWNAIAALASCSLGSGIISPEIAYRFIRCAELVGENVAREKYFDRDEAIEICAKLSPQSAFAALSRWRDREVGRFHVQLPVLASEVVRSNFISPASGMSLLPFFPDHEIEDFVLLCIGKETSVARRKYMLEEAIRHLRIHEAPEKSWRALKSIAEQYSIGHCELDDVIAFYVKNPEKLKYQENYDLLSDSPDIVDFDIIFEGLNLISSAGISDGLKRFQSIRTSYKQRDQFWSELFARIKEENVKAFLNELVNAPTIHVDDLETALSALPREWLKKVSIRQSWPNLFKPIGQLNASYFSSFGFEDFQKNTQIGQEELAALKEGVFEGLSSNNDLVSASAFFGFANVASVFITKEQAVDLLLFGLERFERHIDEEELADGTWSNWLIPPESSSMAFTGLIWSALGSPKSETRWKAAHCVRKLAEFECFAEINALVEWLAFDKVGAFGSHKFPFYNLHARLYLLISFARVSIDSPHILKSHKDIFAFYALESINHILIKYFAAEIALNIETAFPKTYTEDIVEHLQTVCKSKMPVKRIKSYNESVNSYWHEKSEVNTSLKFSHSYDFSRYWFEPLGNVFGVARKEVEELATEIIVNDWNSQGSVSHKDDPRFELWQSRRDRETWHDHSDYPRIDDYSFYLSYHAMLVVASKLLQKMPVIQRGDSEEDGWIEWLHRHLLTRSDGRWLADRRDPAPLRFPKWVHESKTKEWRSEITSDDFLNAIFTEFNGETWLNVYGSWNESDYDRNEHIYISTSVVCPVASQSLLNALSTCPDPNDFKLPEYQEERMEFTRSPFVLKGWVWRESMSVRLDEYDPLAGGIVYPPYQVGQEFIDFLGLTSDLERRNWFSKDSSNPSLRCNIWCTGKPRPDEDPYRSGRRLSASLMFLKNLCTSMKVDIIFKVQFDRRFKRNSYMRDEADGYDPQCKIYILSADGRLRDTETYYQVR